MKAVILVVLFVFVSSSLYAQQGKAKRYSLSAEVGKSGLIYSIVFDNSLKGSRYGLRGGMGTNFGKHAEAIMGLVGVYRLFGNGGRFFEAGIDMHYLYIDIVSNDQAGAPTILYPDYSTNTIYVTFNAGYRVNAGKILFRLGAAPGFTKHEFIPGAYISGGIRF